jgi:glycosyltransferase involved in cell wall biosynthesis
MDGRRRVAPVTVISTGGALMLDELPQLLVLSNEIPQSIHAGCILLQRLLKTYPPEKLLVVGPAMHPRAERLACRYEAVSIPLVRLHTTRLATMKRSLDALGMIPGISLRTARSRLRGFEPQVVLSVMEERFADAASRFAGAAGLPLVLIIHDKPELFDKVYGWAKTAQIRANAKIYRSASARLCVSPEMEQHLRELYGEPGAVLYPNRSEDLAPRPPEQAAELRQPPIFHVGYAGTLAYGYGSQLRELALALRGTQIRLRIYGQVDRASDPLANQLSDVVACRGLISPPEKLWDAVKAECDAVILPYAWESATDDIELYRTHFPSKLPEYLALGMPVITMGPEYATGMRWALGHPSAVISLTENEPGRWVAALTSLADSPQRRVALARAALEAGASDFDPAAIRRQFMDALIRSRARTNQEAGHTT